MIVFHASDVKSEPARAPKPDLPGAHAAKGFKGAKVQRFQGSKVGGKTERQPTLNRER